MVSLLYRVEVLLRAAYNRLNAMTPSARAQAREVEKQREKADLFLSNLADDESGPLRDQHILVDGMWDNPAFWQRFAIFRAAMGLKSAKQTGILGPWRQREVRATMQRFGFDEILELKKYFPVRSDVIQEAKSLVALLSSNDDILNWRLPMAFPAKMAYDSLLKRQELGAVDISKSNFLDLVVELLQNIYATKALLEYTQPDVVYVSHMLDSKYGSLAWNARMLGIKVVLGYGCFGALRYFRLTEPLDIYNWLSRPRPENIEALSTKQKLALEKIGAEYIGHRYAGNTQDIGATYAYQRDRISIGRENFCHEQGWDPRKPVISVYASAWYDFPHTSGMEFFRDFEEWINLTWQIAVESPQFNWVFRAHPCEEWYDGIRITDILSKNGGDHILICGAEISGAAMKEITDAIVTVHGSVALEAVSSGTPVMAADVGWFHDCNIAYFPGSRAKYLAALSRRWWEEINWDDACRNARVFSGFYYCLPSWQENLIYGDHDEKEKLYPRMKELMQRNDLQLNREINCIRTWWGSAEKYYHVFKMSEAESYILPNLRDHEKKV